MYTSYAYLPLKRVGFFKPFLLRRMSTSNKFTIGCPTSNHIEKLGEKLATILESSDVLFLQGSTCILYAIRICRLNCIADRTIFLQVTSVLARPPCRVASSERSFKTPI